MRPTCEHVEHYLAFGEAILHELNCASCGRTHSLLLSRYACSVCGAQCQCIELGYVPEDMFNVSVWGSRPKPKPTLFKTLFTTKGLSYGTKEFWQFVDGDNN